ncbi:hypothetical protein V4F39_05325 [Aquincola sp. MAHUQ-54]|uniref:Secreted protein n=1 Tax=Aquincola agrisoli TaxID=3119538 RepID=A0AAW9QE32_9BURK
MVKRLFMACLAALALSAQAAPVSFVDALFEATAVATTDGVPGFDMQSGPPSELPVLAEADSIGLTTDIALAGAIGGPGLLSTSADVSGASGIASAVATARFTGSFATTGLLSLSIDFAPVTFADGAGSAATSLFVSLVSGGVTLFQDYVTGPWTFEYTQAAGATSLLDLTLSSEATVGFPTAGVGNAVTSGLVSFAVSPVPLPATWLLFLGGLGPIAAAVRVRRAAQAPAG